MLGDASHLKIRAALQIPHCIRKEHPCLSLVKVEPAYQGALMLDTGQKTYFFQSPSADPKILVIYQSIKQDQSMVLS